jgi:hypothetical protein
MTGLDDFKRVLSEFSNLSLWAAGASVAFPFIASFLSVIPPWPIGLNVITAVIQLVTLIVAYQTFSRNARRITRNVKWLAILGLFLLLLYMGIFTLFTVYIPPAHRSIVIGYECLPDAKKVFEAKCPFLTIDDLSAAAFDEFVLWTKPSIMAIRVSLVALWFSVFICLASLIGQFLIYQMGRTVRPASQ